MAQFTYQCRSCGARRAISTAELEAARRGLEQFADSEAELAELMTAGNVAIALTFEFCRSFRDIEQVRSLGVQS